MSDSRIKVHDWDAMRAWKLWIASLDQDTPLDKQVGPQDVFEAGFRAGREEEKK